MKHLKKLLCTLKNCNGSQLIETMISILAIFTVLASCITVLPGYMEYQKLTYFAQSLMRTAEIAGTTDVQQRIDQLKYETKINPMVISWDGTSYINTNGKVQLNNKIHLTIQSRYDLKLMGFTTLTVPMTVRASGASEVYYK